MFEHIMVPIDLAEKDKWRRAVDVASDLAARYRARLTLVSVVGVVVVMREVVMGVVILGMMVVVVVLVMMMVVVVVVVVVEVLMVVVVVVVLTVVVVVVMVLIEVTVSKLTKMNNERKFV